MNDVRRAEELPVEVPPDELEEWLASLDGFIAASGARATEQLIAQLVDRARRAGVPVAVGIQTPQVNTIPVAREPKFPGNLALERRIKSLVRWNAMAMVVRANRQAEGIGGHISTFASAATLYEVGYNHFFRGKDAGLDADQIYFQGHASPGMYARAFLEGRIDEARVANFRQELRDTPGLSSYPHPWLMPDFWEFPTVSMGLGPIMAIYQARFNHYLEDRGLKPKGKGRVWAFLGDGETDEPESLGALTLASRARLDNLIFVVNCNLQRLDGPVRGNGQIIQELEAAFRGAGWHVIKVILGRDWDPLLAKDPEGLIARRWSEVIDGEVQKYSVSDGAYIREHFWGKYPELKKLVDHLSDAQLQKLNLGGHDPVKVYAAYRAAVEHGRGPVVILARTIKGYGLGEHGEGKNVTHQQKKMNEDELREFRARFGIAISDEELSSAPLYRPAPDSDEAVYIRERRAALGGPVPQRRVHCEPLPPPAPSVFEEFFAGSGEDRKVATTMAFVRLLAKLLKDKSVGRYIVPIVPDEARTFGMEALFRQVGIYSHVGQLYEPVDAASLLYYKEARDGQILEEGITEAGSMSSFIAAGTAYATHGIPTIPMFIYYSMFGFQRIGDLVWAAADMRVKGFVLGATAGRTTLSGEGLQHQDGNSQLLAYPVPQLEAYDPAYAYEIAVIIREGIRRMYEKMEDVFYYLTLMNEPYAMPAMPAGVEDGILRGMYLLHAADDAAPRRVQLCGTGSILREAVAARAILAERFGVDADVWSVTSWKALHRDAADVERWNRLHPSRPARTPYFTECLASRRGPVVAASDYVRAVPESVARFSPTPMTTLGTDGFGRSDGRRALRDFFEVDARHIALAALVALARDGKIETQAVEQAISTLDIDPERANPLLR